MGTTDDAGYEIAALDALLSSTIFASKIRYFPSVTSTNRLAMEEACGGAPAGAVFLAGAQSEGRGRGGHSWSSEDGAGIYVSVLLRPRLAAADVLWLSLAAGLAVHDAVRQTTSLEADIRWPNDLLLGKRKFCGILIDLAASPGSVRHAVIGIGINVNRRSFPPELEPLATSLEIETGRRCSRQDLLAALLQSLHQQALALDENCAEAAAGILSRLERASTWLRGKRIRVEEAGGYSGVTAGLDARGFLQVHTPEGLRTVLSGGVREN